MLSNSPANGHTVHYEQEGDDYAHGEEEAADELLRWDEHRVSEGAGRALPVSMHLLLKLVPLLLLSLELFLPVFLLSLRIVVEVAEVLPITPLLLLMHLLLPHLLLDVLLFRFHSFVAAVLLREEIIERLPAARLIPLISIAIPVLIIILLLLAPLPAPLLLLCVPPGPFVVFRLLALPRASAILLPLLETLGPSILLVVVAGVLPRRASAWCSVKRILSPRRSCGPIVKLSESIIILTFL